MIPRLPASLLLAATLVASGVGSSRPAAQNLWYRSYQDGVAAFKKADYATAQRELMAAVTNRLSPKARGRSVLYYGQFRSEFIPEYFLAVIAFKQGKVDEGIMFQKLAEAYLKRGDSEYALLTAARDAADKPPLLAQKLPDSQKPPVGGQSGKEDTNPAPPPPLVSNRPDGSNPPGAGSSARAEFDRIIGEATGLIASQRYGEARQAATRARNLGVDSQRADEIIRTIDINDLTTQINARIGNRGWQALPPLVDRLAAIDPMNALVRRARELTARGIKEDDAARLEREGLGAFYQGNYQKALDQLGRIAADVRTSRVLFYQACSTAAIALLEGERGKTRLQDAQELFRRSQSAQNAFAVDRKYISPHIIKALEARKTS